MKPPILKVTWHHLRKLIFSTKPIIWLEIENLGSSATLTTDGIICNRPLGRGQYELPENHYVELGFFQGQGPIITDELLEDDHVCYSVYLRLENEFGSDVHIETKRIPIVRY